MDAGEQVYLSLCHKRFGNVFGGSIPFGDNEDPDSLGELDDFSVEEIPDDAPLLPLGSPTDVHNSVARFFPGTDWSDAAWGIFDSPFGSIEFNLGNDDPAYSMMLHVRASNEIVAPIVTMCREYGWNGLDCSTGELLENSENPTEGIEGWRDYRDKALGRDSREGGEPSRG